MANMELIEAKTLTTTTANITFSAIPATYTDLHLVLSVRSSKNGNEDGLWISQINGSASNLSNKWLRGSGSSVISSDSATYGILVGQVNGATATASSFSNISIYITDYASANNKSISIDSVQERNATESYMGFTTGLWSNSNAVTSITLDTEVGDFVQYSTAYLYGISKVTSGSKATGGIVSSDGTYWYHLFSHTGTFTPTQSLSADILVVGGGGSGGANIGGGGGAGGLRYFASESLTATGYTCTVGAGGPGPATTPSYQGSNGGTSQFGALTSAVGGGYGGGANDNSASGSGASSGGNRGSNPIGSASLGNIGANHAGINGAGGGGGFSGAGVQGTATTGGTGGVGTAAYSAFAYATGTGDKGYYAGGGGGSGFSFGSGGPFGFGGLGGGADGMVHADDSPKQGKQSTGGGGGGGFNNSTTNPVQYNNGGSGVIIIRYLI
jgi:hypothetical protein